MFFEMRKVRKAFGGLIAVNDVDLQVQPGTIHAIIGPNGAGKTTLFNCITGLRRAEAGQILFEGEDIRELPTHEIVKKGIGRTFQNIRLFPYLSVLENVKVGTHLMNHTNLWDTALKSSRFRKQEKEVHTLCMDLLHQIKLEDKKDFYARNLPYGDQRKLEIARALASKPKLLLLDEPAAGMNPAETAELDDFIRSLKAKGITIILIEHDMKLVMSIADTISVIDYGVKIAEGTSNEIQTNERVIEAYLGKRRS
ncbi:MAG: ABC transporter ATP-binding protein [Spirochaetales bacterium]